MLLIFLKRKVHQVYFPNWGWLHKPRPSQEEVGITPLLQNTLRTSQRKTMKKGRKSKKGKGAKNKSKRNRDIIKKSKGAKAMKSMKVKPTKKQQSPECSETDPKSKKTSKYESATEVPKPKKSRAAVPGRVYQDRVDLGNGKWRYAILDCQWYGCSNCRFIYNGCATCQNPNFRGKTADIVRQEYETKKGRSSKAASATSTSSDKKGKKKSKWRIYMDGHVQETQHVLWYVFNIPSEILY